MKNKSVALMLCLILIASCASHRPKERTMIEDLTKKYRVYGVQNNPYYYFMQDSSGGPHLVRTHMLKSSKVIWIEKLQRQ